jgi:phosphoglucosamine mutase
MMNAKPAAKAYFGTDGIRGSWSDDVINTAFARHFGIALGAFLKQRNPDRPAVVYIGRDTRNSGTALSQAIRDGLSSADAFVCDLGVIPTPAVALVTSCQCADMGIMVTASHNPAEDNGYKVFGPGGLKLTRADEIEIERFINSSNPSSAVEKKVRDHTFNGLAYYINFMRSMLNEGCLNGRRMVVDLANGATTSTVAEVFSRWGGEIHYLGNQPDGDNINSGVGSEHPQALGEAVRQHKAEIGIAFDGDGDRVVIVDENGDVVAGEILLSLLARAESASKQLKKHTLVTTVHSNGGLDRAIAAFGGKTERTDVGDRNVLYRMRELGANMGGESSGHIIFADLIPSGDGFLSAIKFIQLLLKSESSVAELAASVKLFPQAEASLKVKHKPPLDSLVHLPKALKALDEKLLKAGGRVLVRYSGTEPKLRFLVEAEDLDTAQRELAVLIEAANKDLK